jgi:hypothetical protein
VNLSSRYDCLRLHYWRIFKIVNICLQIFIGLIQAS